MQALRELKAQILEREHANHTRDLDGRRRFNTRLRQLRAGGGATEIINLTGVPALITSCATYLADDTDGAKAAALKGKILKLPLPPWLIQDAVEEAKGAAANRAATAAGTAAGVAISSASDAQFASAQATSVVEAAGADVVVDDSTRTGTRTGKSISKMKKWFVLAILASTATLAGQGEMPRDSIVLHTMMDGVTQNKSGFPELPMSNGTYSLSQLPPTLETWNGTETPDASGVVARPEKPLTLEDINNAITNPTQYPHIWTRIQNDVTVINGMCIANANETQRKVHSKLQTSELPKLSTIPQKFEQTTNTFPKLTHTLKATNNNKQKQKLLDGINELNMQGATQSFLPMCEAVLNNTNTTTTESPAEKGGIMASTGRLLGITPAPAPAPAPATSFDDCLCINRSHVPVWVSLLSGVCTQQQTRHIATAYEAAAKFNKERATAGHAETKIREQLKEDMSRTIQRALKEKGVNETTASDIATLVTSENRVERLQAVGKLSSMNALALVVSHGSDIIHHDVWSQIEAEMPEVDPPELAEAQVSNGQILAACVVAVIIWWWWKIFLHKKGGVLNPFDSKTDAQKAGYKPGDRVSYYIATGQRKGMLLHIMD